MNIALLAHDEKKELMVQFCIAYCGILSGHDICATNTTGKLVSEATGLPVTLYLPCTQGGAQQIGARIAYNEIDLVLFFCDPKANTKDVDAIARLAERIRPDKVQINSVCRPPAETYALPVPAAAEVLVQGLRRGDLDWRDIVNPKKK